MSALDVLQSATERLEKLGLPYMVLEYVKGRTLAELLGPRRARQLPAPRKAAAPGKRGQSPFVRSTLRAVPANGDCPLFPPVRRR